MADEEFRREVFSINYQTIVAHNLEADNGLHSYRLAINQFADITTEEFAQKMNGFRSELKKASQNVFVDIVSDLPPTVDWRTKGVVTPVKNQGNVYSITSINNLHHA